MLSSRSGRWFVYACLTILTGAVAFAAMSQFRRQPIFSHATWDEPEMPQTPAGKQVAGFPGVDAQIDIYEDNWTVVVLANYEAVGETVARHIEKLLMTTN